MIGNLSLWSPKVRDICINKYDDFGHGLKLKVSFSEKNGASWTWSSYVVIKYIVALFIIWKHRAVFLQDICTSIYLSYEM